MQGILDKEIPHRLAMLAVQIQPGPPGGSMAFGKVIRAEGREIISIRTQVVVDDIEEDRQTGTMGRVHEPPKIIGPAVTPGRSE